MPFYTYNSLLIHTYTLLNLLLEIMHFRYSKLNGTVVIEPKTWSVCEINQVIGDAVAVDTIIFRFEGCTIAQHTHNNLHTDTNIHEEDG